MLAILAAIVFGFALLLDFLNTDLGAPDLFNTWTLCSSASCCSPCTWPGLRPARRRGRPLVTGVGVRAAADRKRPPGPGQRRDSGVVGPARYCSRDAVRRPLHPRRTRRSAQRPRGAPVAWTGSPPPGADSPLPVRMRPASIDELVGQGHLLAPGAPLRQLVEGATPMSVILWGPPGSGKTTIAHLVARATDRRFVAMSALTAGVKDVRAVIDTARRQRRSGGPPTVLFIDEVHRFSKTQQDSLLAAVEDRTVTLLAATTENPYFSVISPLLSRCVLLTPPAAGRRRRARPAAPRGRRRARARRHVDPGRPRRRTIWSASPAATSARR